MAKAAAATDVVVLADGEAVARRAADDLSRTAADAVAAHGRCALALSGGSTPKRLFEILGAADFRTSLPWTQIHIFWVDERHVPPEHSDSNYGMTRTALLEGLERARLLPASNVHRIHGEAATAAEATARYEEELRRFFHPAPGEVPRFDLILLGMGADGHTASLFPGATALDERTRWIATPWIEKLAAHRITMTLPVINAGVRVLFLVTGVDKAAALADVIEGDPNPLERPARLVRPTSGACRWLVDRAAARLLARSGREAP